MLKKIRPHRKKEIISTFIKTYKKPETHPVHHIHHKTKKKKWTFWVIVRDLILIFLALGFLSAAALAIYISTITVPDFSDFANRKIENSTRIYDRTGQILLYDVHGDVKRQAVTSDKISNLSKEATVAIEDKHFYTHHGIRITSIIRAMIENLKAGEFAQGGSTIDQQVIKNTLLTTKKTIPRKIKEWAMAIKLDSQLTKDQILTIYLNDSDYGGQISGIQTAAKYFFNKDASDLDLAEAAYLAAIPNAPSYYSPYGDHVVELEARKNLVLKNMLDQGMIDNQQYLAAKNEKVTWQQNADESSAAMQFVMYVKSYLEQKYGEDMVYNGGLKVITTLNVDYQDKAQEIVKKYALQNEQDYNAKNGAMVVIDPKTGQILVMVGSRDYNDTEIDGKYNVAIHQNRQPGSSFKPIVYATAFEKGYTPDSVVFDVPTEFSTNCNPDGTPIPPHQSTDCYHPQNYDSTFAGPISLRNALAQSLNVPAVKVLYLAGIQNSITTAKNLGITSLNDNNYGLSLVLGAAPVSLLELTNAYATFANEGVYNPYAFILEVDDSQGNVLEKYTPNPKQVLPKFITDEVTSVLADNEARTPLEGANSPLYFPGHDVAAKTGTTNEFRDAWTIGYTPNIVVGVWAGNNNNEQINKGMSGLVAVPMWSEFIGSVLADYPNDKFDTPQIPPTLKPIDDTPPVSGIYCYSQNGQNYAYSILNTDSSQYNLWKVPADTWMSTHSCPFSQLPNNNNGSTSVIINNPNNPDNPIQINYTFN